MPRLPSFRTTVVDDLVRQLRYTPPTTLREHLHRAESLLAELADDRRYPGDFIVFRLTGYRPDSDPHLAPDAMGRDLVADLATLVTHLTRRVPLDPVATGRTGATPEEIAADLGVAPRTIRRWRSHGLALHFVQVEDDETAPRLWCLHDALAQFSARRPDLVGSAGQFRRTSPEERAAIVEQVRRLRREGVAASITEAARRVGAAHGRSHETVRSILRDDRGDCADGGTDCVRTSAARARRLADRARRRGIPVEHIATHLDRSPHAVRRLAREGRFARLAGLRFEPVELPTFARPDAAEVILGAPPVLVGTEALARLDRPARLLAWFDGLGSTGATAATGSTGATRSTGTTGTTDGVGRPDASSDDDATEPAPLDAGDPATTDTLVAIAAARAFLLRRVAQRLQELRPRRPAAPGAIELDAIETDLRWAARLERRLVSAGLCPALRAIQQGLGDRLVRQPAEIVQAGLRTALDAASRAVERWDPTQGELGRLAAWEGGRAVARATWPTAAGGGRRASARHPEDLDVGLRWHDRPVWAHLVEPSASSVATLAGLDPDAASLVAQHLGLDLTMLAGPDEGRDVDVAAAAHGQAPRSIATLAADGGTTVTSIARRLAAAERLRRATARHTSS